MGYVLHEGPLLVQLEVQELQIQKLIQALLGLFQGNFLVLAGQ